MNGTHRLLDQIEIDLEDLTVYIDVYDTSLSRKWLAALDQLLQDQHHLEKNYCFLGFHEGPRSAEYMCEQINQSIAAINAANLGYHIDDVFTVENSLYPGDPADGNHARKVRHDKFNYLHRYFEDLQGVAGSMSQYYAQADPATRWHIRQLNLLCHEFESWALSWRKSAYLPEWVRPSQLMCWLRAPRFVLDEADLDLFGVDTIARPFGGVYVGVNKDIGKHHWEVFTDEAQLDPTVKLTDPICSVMRGQTEASGDFDIEWGAGTGRYEYMQERLNNFRAWLRLNGFDPEDKTMTIGHPQIGQVDLPRSFGTENCSEVWAKLNTRLNVTAIRTTAARAEYPYHWSDADYPELQIKELT